MVFSRWGETGPGVGLDGVELIMAVERDFQVEISDQQAGRLHTVGDLHSWICDQLLQRPPLHPVLQGRSARSWTSEEVWRHLQQLVSYHLSVPLQAVRPEAHIVHDLGAS